MYNTLLHGGCEEATYMLPLWVIGYWGHPYPALIPLARFPVSEGALDFIANNFKDVC